MAKSASVACGPYSLSADGCPVTGLDVKPLMTPNSRNNSPYLEGGEQDFHNIARQVLEAIGTEFFSTLVKQLGGVLRAECVYTGEFLHRKSDRVRTLAACVDCDRQETFEFPLAGSPDAEVARGSPCMYARRVRETFPGGRLLIDLKAEAWVGVPLQDPDGQVCGLIAALFRQPRSHFVVTERRMAEPRVVEDAGPSAPSPVMQFAEPVSTLD